MDKKRIIANWKSHKTAEETVLFLESLKNAWPLLHTENKEIILLVPFTSLSAAGIYIISENLPVMLGSQNISSNDEGAYTGEVNGAQIAEFASFTLINHSERRRYNHEADQEARAKVLEAVKYKLMPIVCIQDENSSVPDGVTEIVYEPPSAISTFQEGAHAETVADVERVFSSLKEKHPSGHFYYGGSVNEKNIADYAKIPEVSGFLIGSASLDVEQFARIIDSW
ncbi:MAG: triose-phosphate isomerase [Candidatus Levyibacteriota bacterium]